MAAAAAFADILEEKVRGLGEPHGHREPSARRFVPPQFVPSHPLLFAPPHRPFRAAAYRAPASDAASAYRRPSAARPPRPRRTLTSRQRQALDAFTQLGADLAADFTAGELRSAFRLLALTYHPDRHPDSSEGERARLTRLLADVNEHHRHLMAATRTSA